MQVCKGLDITTNNIKMHERLGLSHHLLGDLDSSHAELTPSQFRPEAAAAISDISFHPKLPIHADGSKTGLNPSVEPFPPN